MLNKANNKITEHRHKAIGRQNRETMVNFESKTSFLVSCAQLTVYIKWTRDVVRVRIFNGTFNNISVISWRSALLVEEAGVPQENHLPAQVTDTHITWICFECTSPWTGFELTRLVVIGTEWISSGKSNYHQSRPRYTCIYTKWAKQMLFPKKIG